MRSRNLPIEGASVTLDIGDGPTISRTESGGQYRFDRVPTDAEGLLSVTAQGYKPFERQLSPRTRSEFRRILLWNVASAGANVQTGVRQALVLLRQKIETEYPSGDLNLALYAYGRVNNTGALVCVADLRASVPDRTPIRIGRTPVGRCFRRKQPLQINTLNGLAVDMILMSRSPAKSACLCRNSGWQSPSFVPSLRVGELVRCISPRVRT